jgi:hypothetical protein
MWATWSAFATGEFAKTVTTPILVALATSVVADGIKRWCQERNRCKNAIFDEIKRAVDLIRDLSVRVSTEVEIQLIGKPTKSFQSSQQQVGSHMKGIMAHAGILKLYIPPEDAVVFENAHYKWHNELIAEPYPIQKKTDALAAHDPRIGQVNAANAEWLKFLSKFLMDCATKRIDLNA